MIRDMIRDRVKGSVGKSYDEIEGVTVSVSGNFNMLSEITTGKEVKKLDCLSITKVINICQHIYTIVMYSIKIFLYIQKEITVVI